MRIPANILVSMTWGDILQKAFLWTFAGTVPTAGKVDVRLIAASYSCEDAGAPASVATIDGKTYVLDDPDRPGRIHFDPKVVANIQNPTGASVLTALAVYGWNDVNFLLNPNFGGAANTDLFTVNGGIVDFIDIGIRFSR